MGTGILYMEPLFLKIAIDFGIKTVIPFNVYFGEEKDLVSAMRYRTKKSNIWFKSKYISDSEKRFAIHMRNNYYFYDHVTANCLLKLGVLSRNPWFMGSGKILILFFTQ